MSWKALSVGNKELAAFGEARFSSRVAYLGTIQKDGSPRVHPVTPIIGGGQLFVGMYANSPKGYDLRRDGRYALHCSVEDDEGGQGEFVVFGQARSSEDPDLRAIAAEHAPYEFSDKHVLFVLEVEKAFSTTYSEHETIRNHWKAQAMDRSESGR